MVKQTIHPSIILKQRLNELVQENESQLLRSKDEILELYMQEWIEDLTIYHIGIREYRRAQRQKNPELSPNKQIIFSKTTLEERTKGARHERYEEIPLINEIKGVYNIIHNFIEDLRFGRPQYPERYQRYFKQ